jgi:lipoate-protein ligase A
MAQDIIENWKLLYTPDETGLSNMATDKYFLHQCNKELEGWVVRLYTWKPWCFSLGNAQKKEQELYLDKVMDSGLESVKRMTGGRVVYHAKELTYSVIGPLDQVSWTDSLANTYQKINEVLLEGLKEAGFSTELEKGDVTDTFLKNGANKPCFASTSRSELVYDKRKVVGSAQRRLRKAFIQHGSILVGPQHLDVAQHLKTEDPEGFRAQLAKNSSYLEEQKPVDFVALKESIEKAFINHFGSTPKSQEITTLERKDIAQIALEY